jgi:hypothetical protein
MANTTGQTVTLLNNVPIYVQFKVNIGSTSTGYTEYFSEGQQRSIDLGTDTFREGVSMGISAHADSGTTHHFDGLVYQANGARINLVATGGSISDWQITLA